MQRLLPYVIRCVAPVAEGEPEDENMPTQTISSAEQKVAFVLAVFNRSVVSLQHEEDNM